MQDTALLFDLADAKIGQLDDDFFTNFLKVVDSTQGVDDEQLDVVVVDADHVVFQVRAEMGESVQDSVNLVVGEAAKSRIELSFNS